MADGGKPTVTKARADRMSKQNLDSLNTVQQKLEKSNGLAIPISSRPTLTTQHSSSLPSTPYVQPRELSDDCKTPSPIIKAKEISSPRSSRSESDSTVRSGGRIPYLGGCKFETGMAYSRRRFPYTLGDAPLPQEKQVKKSLDTGDEGKLSGDMRELYDRLLPSADSDLRRSKFVAKLEKILNEKWPGNNIKVHVFGSSGNLLFSHDSDVDICITTPMKALERMCLLAKTLAEHGMERVVCVPQAKVPIVKIWDPELQLACDMNVNNTLALENTRMIRTYVQIDPRVRPLAMVIKHWTRSRILNDAALGATLSSYTWICLIINFLQTRKPPVLPALQKRPHQCLKDEHGKLSSFADDLASLSGYGNPNKESIGQLLFHFFRRYGHELDYDKNVVSIREGGLIPKKSKPWHLAQNKLLGVEEPFNTDRNLGNTVDDISFRGVHQELRRAFDNISRGKLSEACEQYEYPAQEEKFWSKPAPQPRPVLSRSLSQDRRKMHQPQPPTLRHSAGHKSRIGPAGRRASIATAVNNRSAPSSIVPPGQPNGTVEGLSGTQLHDQLIHHYQMLQAQEQQLRMQMQQRQEANIHAQMTVGVHQRPVPMPASAHPHQRGFDIGRRPTNVEAGPMSAPLRAMQGFYYPMPTPAQGSRSPQPRTASASQSITNPPSPSLSIAQPPTEHRRGMQRSLTGDNISAAARSHSQPPSSNSGRNARNTPRSARLMPALPHYTAMNGQMLPYLHQYQHQFMQNRRPSELQQMQSVYAAQMAAAESPRMMPMPFDGNDDGIAPRQYVGYYVDPVLQPRVDRDGFMPSISGYYDLANRTRTASASPNLSRLRTHASRSPSPSHSTMSQDISNSFYSVRSHRSNSNLAASSFMSPLQSRSPEKNFHARNGPLIVDGSGDAQEYASPLEQSFLATSRGEEVSSSDEHACDTPSSTSVVTAQEYQEPFVLDPAPGNRSSQPVTNGLQFGDFPVRTSISTSRAIQSTDIKHDLEQINSMDDGTLSQSGPSEQPNGLGIGFVPSDASSPEAPAGRSSQVQMVCTGDPGAVTTSISAPSPIPAPLLSPVREVRTPSPTTTRSNSLVGSELPRATHGRASSLVKDVISSPLAQSSASGLTEAQQPRVMATSSIDTTLNGTDSGKGKTPEAKQVTPEGGKKAVGVTTSSPAQISGWQQSVSKKNKKTRKASSVGSATLMQEQMQKKGG